MGRQVILILLTLLTGCCKPTYFAIRTISSDIFYNGVSNPFFLNGHNIQKAVVTVDNGKLTVDTLKTDTANYFITVGSEPKTTVTVSFNKKTYKYIYRVKRIPDPEIKIHSDSGTIVGGYVSQDKFRRAYKHGLIPVLNSFDYNTAMKVINYKLTAIVNGQRTTNYFNGAIITSDFVKDAVVGDIYIFHDINIEILNTTEKRTVGGLTVIVK